MSLDSCYPFGIGPDSKFNQLHVELFWYATKTIHQCISMNTFRVKGLKGLWCKSNVFSERDFETTNTRLSSAVHVACRGRSWHFLWGPYDIIVSECCSCNWRTRCACLTRKGGDLLPPLSAWKTGAKFCRCQAEACALRYFCAILVEAVVNKLLCLLSYCWTYAPSFHVSSRQFKCPWGIAARVFRTVLETL